MTCHRSYSCDTEGSNSGIAENSSLFGCKAVTLGKSASAVKQSLLGVLDRADKRGEFIYEKFQ